MTLSEKSRWPPFLFAALTLRVCARLCRHLAWTGVPLPDIWHFSGTPHQSFWSLLHLSFPVCLCVIAAALCDVCAVTVRVPNIDCVPIHYSAPLARHSKRAAALAVTGQPGIHESVIILSSLSVSLPFLLSLCIYSFRLHPSFCCLFLCLLCQSLSLSTCHLSASRPPPLTSTAFSLPPSSPCVFLLLLLPSCSTAQREYGCLNPVLMNLTYKKTDADSGKQ